MVRIVQYPKNELIEMEYYLLYALYNPLRLIVIPMTTKKYLFLNFPREIRGSNWICACSGKVDLPFSLVLQSADVCSGGKMNRERCQKSQDTSAAVS